MADIDVAIHDQAGRSLNLKCGRRTYHLVRSVKQWVMTNGGKQIRLGMGSMHWANALRRAVEQIEGGHK